MYPSTYRLPDLLSLCSWKGSFNSNYGEIVTGSSEWLLSYVRRVPELRDMMEVFRRTSGELLAAYTFPHANAERLRVCADLVNFLFVIDEMTDVQNGREAESSSLMFLNAMRDDAYDDGSPLCEMTKDFKHRFQPFIDVVTWHRFLKHFEDYLDSVGREAKLREKGVILDLKSYEIQRRDCSAVLPTFDLIGYVLGADLPDEIFHHPLYVEMHIAAVDMVTWSNDLYSYKAEQSSGQSASNVLTVLQKERNVTLQEAADLVGVHFKTLVDRFEAAQTQLPSFGKELDDILSKFVKGLEDWVVGNLEWSFASQRYFGKNHEEVKTTLGVDLYFQRGA